MAYLLEAVLNSSEKDDLRDFIKYLRQADNAYLLRNEILQAYELFCADVGQSADALRTSRLGKLVYAIQEVILDADSLCFIVRPQIARHETYRLHDDLSYEPLDRPELLDIRDRLVDQYRPDDGDVFEIDFGPFYDYSPMIRDAKNIGRGVRFLNRYLSSKLFQDPAQWLSALYKFLRLHRYNETVLLINERICDQRQLSDQVKTAISFTRELPPTKPYEDFRADLQALGFEPGWGNTAARIHETLEILDELIDSPDDEGLEEFLSRIPLIFRIVLVSVHGWFAQTGVLGRPDTSGQVVYVLDQARALEQQLQQDIQLAGLASLEIQPKVVILTRLIPESEGTSCHERLEKVENADNAWILRVPFRDFGGGRTQGWISRHEIWPYLETFAIDAEKQLFAELDSRPDLIVGNYADGNLVAFLLARRLKVTQFAIAHALEKPKYLFSNLYWQDLEDSYHFSAHFTADLIAMNAANCVISSTYQEIAGRRDSVGQYESYESFTMPGLYHVLKGIELYSPKFNIVPPGVDETIFFSYLKAFQRSSAQTERLEQTLFHLDHPYQTFGQLEDASKRPIFALGRMDHSKNMSGLVECFALSPELQAKCNLILVTTKIMLPDAMGYEEQEEIERIYELIDRYELQGKLRWLGIQFSRSDCGEVYRIIAEHQGLFVQPALFEPFGLTALEAMASGLPTFATEFGGPIEIIQDNQNGFHINPTQLEGMAQKMLDFVNRCDHNPQNWARISAAAIARVQSTYTWKNHTRRLLSLARIYGFWNYTSKEEREDMLRYIESLFYLLYKPRARELL
ncbi:MAG: sucrose synthase [Cyanobacteria bacterium P01_H01_bin.15]